MYQDLQHFLNYLEQDIEKVTKINDEERDYFIEIAIPARLELIEEELEIFDQKMNETNDDKIAELEGEQRKDWLYFAIVLPLVISLSIASALVIMTTTVIALGVIAIFVVPCILGWAYFGLTNTGYDLYKRSAKIKALTIESLKKKVYEEFLSKGLVKQIQLYNTIYLISLDNSKIRRRLQKLQKQKNSQTIEDKFLAIDARVKASLSNVFFPSEIKTETYFKEMKKYFERINIKYSKIVLHHKILEHNLNDTKGLQAVINNFNESYSEFNRFSQLLNSSKSHFQKQIAEIPETCKEEPVIFSKLTLIITGGLLVGVIGLIYLSPAFVFPLIPLLVVSLQQKVALSFNLPREYKKYQDLSKECEVYSEHYGEFQTMRIESKKMHDYVMQIQAERPNTLII